MQYIWDLNWISFSNSRTLFRVSVNIFLFTFSVKLWVLRSLLSSLTKKFDSASFHKWPLMVYSSLNAFLSIQQRCNSTMQIKIRDPDLAKNGFKRTVRGKMLSVTGEKLSEGPALPQPGASVDPWPAIWKRRNKSFLYRPKRWNKWLARRAFHGSTEP